MRMLLLFNGAARLAVTETGAGRLAVAFFTGPVPLVMPLAVAVGLAAVRAVTDGFALTSPFTAVVATTITIIVCNFLTERRCQLLPGLGAGLVAGRLVALGTLTGVGATLRVAAAADVTGGAPAVLGAAVRVLAETVDRAETVVLETGAAESVDAAAAAAEGTEVFLAVEGIAGLVVVVFLTVVAIVVVVVLVAAVVGLAGAEADAVDLAVAGRLMGGRGEAVALADAADFGGAGLGEVAAAGEAFRKGDNFVGLDGFTSAALDAVSAAGTRLQ